MGWSQLTRVYSDYRTCDRMIVPPSLEFESWGRSKPYSHPQHRSISLLRYLCKSVGLCRTLSLKECGVKILCCLSPLSVWHLNINFLKKQNMLTFTFSHDSGPWVMHVILFRPCQVVMQNSFGFFDYKTRGPIWGGRLWFLLMGPQQWWTRRVNVT